MRIKIIAPYKDATSSGMFGADGKEVEIGTEMTVDEKTFDLPANRYEVIEGSGEDKVGILNPAQGQPINKASDSTDGENPFPGAESAPQSQMDGRNATPSAATATGYVVTEAKPGWFAITKDDEPVTKNFRESELDGFETMSDEDKQAFVELHKKPE